MTHAPTQLRPPGRRGGFTLIEVLVVASIIVLMLGLALPVFRVITGSRSQEGAANQVAAFLARARTDAVGLQVNTGVAFYTDSTGQAYMAEVQQVQVPAWDSTAAYSKANYVNNAGSYAVCILDVPAATGGLTNTAPASDATHWATLTAAQVTLAAANELVDQVAGTDVEPLPTGVGVQVLNDAGTAATDRYLHSGTVMFDASGRLVSQPYVVIQYGPLGIAAGFKTAAIDLANNQPTTDGLLYSAVGVVLYDAQAEGGQGFPTTDYVVSGGNYGSVGSSPPSMADEEKWLDTNASPLLINRYNGTPLRSE